MAFPRTCHLSQWCENIWVRRAPRARATDPQWSSSRPVGSVSGTSHLWTRVSFRQWTRTQAHTVVHRTIEIDTVEAWAEIAMQTVQPPA